jgi:hypothetical protein
VQVALLQVIRDIYTIAEVQLVILGLMLLAVLILEHRVSRLQKDVRTIAKGELAEITAREVTEIAANTRIAGRELAQIGENTRTQKVASPAA